MIAALRSGHDDKLPVSTNVGQQTKFVRFDKLVRIEPLGSTMRPSLGSEVAWTCDREPIPLQLQGLFR